jgi:hypothetical protein
VEGRAAGPSFCISAGEIAPDLPDAPAEWIPIVQEQRRLAVHVSGARDDGFDLALGPVPPAEPAGEGAAEYAFRDSVLTLGQLSVRSQAGELRNRPGAARRTVVRARLNLPLFPGITPIGRA